MLWVILMVLLVVLILASLPRWPYSGGWVSSPAGMLILLQLWLLGVITIRQTTEPAPPTLIGF